jgi:hypothetical protein
MSFQRQASTEVLDSDVDSLSQFSVHSARLAAVETETKKAVDHEPTAPVMKPEVKVEPSEIEKEEEEGTSYGGALAKRWVRKK